MKALRLFETGGPGKLRLEDIPEPAPAPGEALVRLRTAALNHRDVFITQGLYRGIRLPATLGSDGCGEADGTRVVLDPTIGWGSDQRVWHPDATILGMPRDGTFAEYVAVPEENVHPKPGHLSDEEAAALPLAGVTAYRALFSLGRLQKGEKILMTGIGGGVQSLALLFAAAAGARIAVTSGSDAKLERAKDLGAHAGANYKTDPEWQKTLRSALGDFDLVIDSAGGESFARALTVVRPGGRVVSYGATAGDAKVRMFPIFWNQLDVYGSSMGSPADFRAMLAFVSEHRIKPVIDRVYNLEDVVDAALRLDAAEQFGKIVFRIAS